jgi:hypothetical protein
VRLPSLSRWRRRLLGTLATGVAAVLLVAAPASAAEETTGIDLPAGTAAVWIDVEQAGLQPADVVLSVSTGGAWRPVALVATTFGLHATLAASPGRLALSIAGAPGSATVTPDVALTALDAAGTVLASGQARVEVVPGAATPIVVQPASDPAAASASAPRSGALALTGPGQIAIGVALALLAAGALVLLGRRALRARTGEGR